MSFPQNSFTSSRIPTTPVSLSSDKSKRKRNDPKAGYINNLYDELLLLILKKIPIKTAVQTSVLSKRWEHVWKKIPSLNFDMKTIIECKESLVNRSDFIAQVITQVIKNHNGHLEWCKIQHFSYQSKDGTLETWIRSLTQVKHTKSLSLINIGSLRRRGSSVLQLSPNIFSHPSLTSLILYQYDLDFAHSFNKCRNLLTLKLDQICAEVDVFNKVIALCPSLKVLVLDITWYSKIGCLKIHNNNLKLLHLSCTYIDRIEVVATLLDIFAIHCVFFTKSNFTLTAPRIIGLKKHYWATDGSIPYICYNISCDAQGIKNIWHEFAVTKDIYYLMRFRYLVVNVDLRNPREISMLKEVCDAWGGEMRKLKVFFKHDNVYNEEGESSTGGEQNKKLKGKEFFLSHNFRVRVVSMHTSRGFSKEELVFASLLVTQGTVTEKLMIKTIPENRNLIKAAMAELMKLPKGNKELMIECV